MVICRELSLYIPFVLQPLTPDFYKMASFRMLFEFFHHYAGCIDSLGNVLLSHHWQGAASSSTAAAVAAAAAGSWRFQGRTGAAGRPWGLHLWACRCSTGGRTMAGSAVLLQAFAGAACSCMWWPAVASGRHLCCQCTARLTCC
jgi:hypothetical protein